MSTKAVQTAETLKGSEPLLEKPLGQGAQAVETGESIGVFSLVLRSPIMLDGESVGVLAFDLDRLTGYDSLAIERELSMLNIPVHIPAVSGEYLLRALVRGCERPIDVEDLKRLRISDYSTLRTKAMNFFLLLG